MKNCIIYTVGVAVACLAAKAPAASITWEDAQSISAGSDVNTEGVQVFGRNIGLASGNASAIVNGVDFGYSNPGWSVTFSESAGGTNNGGVVAPTVGGPDAANYAAVMTNSRYWTGPMSITLGNLTVGRDYLLQFWVGDWRNFSSDRAETIAVAGPNTNVNTQTLKFLDSDLSNTPNAAHGQYVIGRFTADATSVTFDVTNTTDVYTQYNALQLRDVTASVPEPSSILLVGLGAATQLRRRKRNR